MSEFIREVDEDYRQDQIRALLNRYWVAIAALVLLVLIGVGGWRGALYYRQQQAEAASTRYFDATQLFPGDKAASQAALDALAKDGPAGYRTLARFKAASQAGGTDAAAGAKAFDALADDQTLNADLREIARLRAAMLVMDSADPADIRRRLERLADANAPFRNLAREMLAVDALKRGNEADAKRWLDAEMTDAIAAQDQRQRAGFLLSLVRSGKPGEVAPAAAVSAPVPAVSDVPAPAPVAPGPAPTPPAPDEAKPSEPAPPAAQAPVPSSPPEPDQPPAAIP